MASWFWKTRLYSLMRPTSEEEKLEDLFWIQIEVEDLPGWKGGTS
jgi:hypothetical protein